MLFLVLCSFDASSRTPDVLVTRLSRLHRGAELRSRAAGVGRRVHLLRRWELFRMQLRCFEVNTAANWTKDYAVGRPKR